MTVNIRRRGERYPGTLLWGFAGCNLPVGWEGRERAHAKRVGERVGAIRVIHASSPRQINCSIHPFGEYLQMTVRPGLRTEAWRWAFRGVKMKTRIASLDADRLAENATSMQASS